MGTDRQTDRHACMKTHQHHDSDQPKGRAEWKYGFCVFFQKWTKKNLQLKFWNCHPNLWTISLLLMRRFLNYTQFHCSFNDENVGIYDSLLLHCGGGLADVNNFSSYYIIIKCQNVDNGWGGGGQTMGIGFFVVVFLRLFRGGFAF